MEKRRFIFMMMLITALPTIIGGASAEPLYRNSGESIDVRVKDLLGRMTLQEKIAILAGTGFATPQNDRLGIPALKMTDGPLGVRWQRSTSFPAGIAMAASYDRNLMRKVANAMGLEVRAKGRDMLLGPCVGISRLPFGGRNFEGMGEDPYLTGEMATAYVEGLNDQKVVGSVKHFALNDQEANRTTIDSIADERALEEIHLFAFHRAVEAGVGSVMASYNLVNGLHSTENPDLLKNILKDQFAFKGFVISDWGATHSTVPAASAGLDLEMPTPEFFGGPLMAAVQAGQLPQALIDEKVSRILWQIFHAGLFDGADRNRPPASVIDSSEHRELSLEMSREGHVLLQNENHILPLNLDHVQNIAVIGPNAGIARTAGGGSSFVQTNTAASILDGLRDRVGGKANVQYSLGVQMPVPVAAIETPQLTPARGVGNGLYAEYFNNANLQGTPTLTRVDPAVSFFWDAETSPDPSIGFTNFSVRWTGQLTVPLTGQYRLLTNSNDGVRLWLNGKLLIDDWTEHGPTIDSTTLSLEAGRGYDLKLEYYQVGRTATIQLGWQPPQQALFADAVKLAGKSDAVILAVGFDSDLEGEAIDRATFQLPKMQDELIEAVSEVNPHTIVVINTGNPVDMHRWINKVEAIVYAWYAGEEGGHALADILLGNYNPSGRLPVTMLKRWQDSPAYGTYPGTDGKVVYKEGIYVGYRYFDKSGVATNFPFGHGLSYTSFDYSDLKIRAIEVSAANPKFKVDVTVTNGGQVAGAEVPQLYVHDHNPKVERPVQELKGFDRVTLQPGESRRVRFLLNTESFAFYDVTSHRWQALPGRFSVRIGSSSRDIRVTGEVELK